jgi:hypothetical protein
VFLFDARFLALSRADMDASYPMPDPRTTAEILAPRGVLTAFHSGSTALVKRFLLSFVISDGRFRIIRSALRQSSCNGQLQ